MVRTTLTCDMCNKIINTGEKYYYYEEKPHINNVYNFDITYSNTKYYDICEECHNKLHDCATDWGTKSYYYRTGIDVRGNINEK